MGLGRKVLVSLVFKFMHDLLEVRCLSCDAIQTLDRGLRLRWLQRAGHLRRVNDPSSPLIDELFKHQFASFVCSECGSSHLRSKPMDVRRQSDSEAEFCGEQRLCQSCRQPIGRERLEALPTATLCIDCQNTESCATACNTLSDEACPKCGGWLHWKFSASEIGTRRLHCPVCN